MRDEQLIVIFYTEAVWNEDKGEDVPVVFIKKRIRGQSLETFHKMASEQDFKDYEPEYQAFIRREDVVNEGTDLIHLGLLQARIDSLKKMDIFTIEQLGALPEQIIPHLGMGGREIIKQAKDFVSAGKTVTDSFSEEREALLARIEKLEGRTREVRKPMSEETKQKLRDSHARRKQEKINELAATG